MGWTEQEMEPLPQTPQKASNGQVTFWVPGKPVGQGRISTINGHSFHSNAKELKPWREKVAWCARSAHVPLLDGPVQVEYRFVFLRPKSVKRNLPCVKPDLDHLERALGDALSGVAFVDDALICKNTSTKVYGEAEGVEIIVGALL